MGIERRRMEDKNIVYDIKSEKDWDEFLVESADMGLVVLVEKVEPVE